MSGLSDNQQTHSELYRSLIQGLPDLVYRFRFEPPRFEYISPSSTRMLGYTPEEFYADPELGTKIVHPDDRPMLLRLMENPELFQNPPPFHWVCKDGRIIWTEHHNTLIQDETGRIIAVQGVARDITERRRIEQELSNSEQKANDLFRYAPTAIYEVDFRTRRFTRVNDAMCQLSGYSRKELLELDAFELLEPESRVRFSKRIQKSMAGGEIDRFVEYDIITKDRRRLVAILNTTPLYQDGKAIGAFVIGQDITERKQMEETLRASERRTQEILESISDGFWAVDDQWRFVYMNRRAAENLGYEPAELIGENLWKSFPDVRGTRHEEYYRKVMEDRAPAHFEITGVLTERSYSVSVYPTGKGISVYWRDITERKRGEEEREESRRREQAARAEAEAAVQVRDQFISLASNELKTPLTTIKGYAELLALRGEQAHLDPSLRRMLNTINTQTGRLEKIISALLDVTRIERGQLSLDVAPVDLLALVQCVVDDVRPTLRKHTLEFKCTGEKIVVQGDESRLEQVLQNLIQNAIKYSPLGGKVTIELAREDGAARIAVTDQGLGIPTEDLPRMFTRFYRASNAEKQHISGLGVGLYVVQQIVRLHRGEVTVTSQEGMGSTFTVHLPLA